MVLGGFRSFHVLVTTSKNSLLKYILIKDSSTEKCTENTCRVNALKFPKYT